MPTLAQIQPEGTRAVRITRAFDAPRAAVWRAFTDPTILAHWLLGPPGWQMQQCDITLKTHGGYRWTWANPATGQTFGFTGTYLVVDPEHRLIDDQVFDTDSAAPAGPATRNTVVFDEDGQGAHVRTRVTTDVRYPDAATRDMVLAQGLGEGMEASYLRLDRMMHRAAA